MGLLENIFRARNELDKQDVQPGVIIMNESDANELEGVMLVFNHKTHLFGMKVIKVPDDLRFIEKDKAMIISRDAWEKLREVFSK